MSIRFFLLAVAATAHTLRRDRDSQWANALDAALSEPAAPKKWVTVSTTNVPTVTTGIVESRSTSNPPTTAPSDVIHSNAATGNDNNAATGTENSFNPTTVQHLSVMADQEAEDTAPPCPEGAECPDDKNDKGEQVESTSKAAVPDHNDGTTEIATAKAANHVTAAPATTASEPQQETFEFQPSQQPDGKNVPIQQKGKGSPQFLHDLVNRHKKRHARLQAIKNHAVSFKKEIQSIQKAHQKDRQLFDAHTASKKKEAAATAAKAATTPATTTKEHDAHFKKHEQEVIKMGKQISEVLKIVKLMATQMKTQKTPVVAPTATAADKDDDDDDNEVEKDVDEDAVQEKEEEDEEKEEEEVQNKKAVKKEDQKEKQEEEEASNDTEEQEEEGECCYNLYLFALNVDSPRVFPCI